MVTIQQDLTHAYHSVKSQQFPYLLPQTSQSVSSELVHPSELSPQEPGQVPATAER